MTSVHNALFLALYFLFPFATLRAAEQTFALVPYETKTLWACIGTCCTSWRVPQQHVSVVVPDRFCEPILQADRKTNHFSLNWFGKASLLSSQRDGAFLWFETHAATSLNDSKINIYIVNNSGQQFLALRSGDAWLATWDSPRLDTWLWVTVHSKADAGSCHLCLSLRYGRNTQALLEQCAPIGDVKKTSTGCFITKLVFQPEVRTHLLSLNGQPVLGDKAEKQWMQGIVCTEELLRQASLGTPRYIDDLWTIEPDHFRGSFSYSNEVVLLRLIQQCDLLCVSSSALFENAHNCSIRWSTTNY